MSRLTLLLLGPPRIQLDGKDLQLQRRKVVALLAYLAVTSRSHARDALTDLLYPAQTRSQAHADFRQVLSHLRSAIGEDWLQADRNRVSMAGGPGMWTDVLEFRSLVSRLRSPAAGPQGPELPQLLGQAAGLYRGDFLAGFYLRDSPSFEEWQLSQEEDLRREYAGVLERLVALHGARMEFETAISYARCWLGLDPLEETVHRHLMRLYSRAGMRAAALRQYERCREMLGRELGEQPEEETQQLHAEILHRVMGRAAQQASPAPARFGFRGEPPLLCTALVGRERELAELLDLLKRPEVRILTLTGPGGTGKTRLAIQAAAGLQDAFADGLYFIDLAALREPAQVATTIAASLEIRESMGQGRPLTERLRQYLSSRSLLLVLDNFEHLQPAIPMVLEILNACPGCKTLLTSRVSLHILGGREYPVPSLSLPEPGEQLSAERLARSEAVRLLALRAGEARPGFRVGQREAAAVAEICRRLDGLPLAIELAASRLRILSVQDLLERLTDRLRLLTAEDASLPERQRTLRKTIDWSFELLEPWEKRLFARLSTFSGGCGLNAAEAVGRSPADEAVPDVLQGLASLVEKNLLRRLEVGGETRVCMLETIREYALERLRYSPEAEEVVRRHAVFFLTLAETAEPALRGPDQLAWLDRLERENGNLQAAMSYFLVRGMAPEALRLGKALSWFWYRYGHFSSGLRQMEQALGLAGASEPTLTRAAALHALGWLCFIQGEWNRAEGLYQESLELTRLLGDRGAEAAVLSDLGVTRRWLGREQEGTRDAEEAVRLARGQGDPLRLAIALIWAYATTGGRFQGQAPLAELQEAVYLSRSVGDLWCIAHALNGLGDLYRGLGKPNAARPLYEEALKDFERLKDRWMKAWTLEGLGMVSYLVGEARGAAGCFRQALTLFDLLGDRGNAAFLISRLGLTARARAAHARAARLLGAFEGIQEALLGREAAAKVEHSAELAAALAEYRSQWAEPWAQGRAMSLEQAVAFALKTERRGAP